MSENDADLQRWLDHGADLQEAELAQLVAAKDAALRRAVQAL